jgi:TonB family protein
MTPALSRRVVFGFVACLSLPIVAAAQTPTEAQLNAQVAQQPQSVGPLLDLAKFYADRQMLQEAQVTVERALGLLNQQLRERGLVKMLVPEPLPPPPVRQVVGQAGAVRVGADIKQPKQIRRVEPQYPEDAKAAGTTGMVILEVLLDTEGRVKQAAILRHVTPSIDQAALNAVQQWVYSPTLLNGNPVEVVFTVTVNFVL